MAFEVVESGTSKIAIIRIVNPPINAVSAPVRHMIVDGLRNASQDESIDAVVLCGAGRLFASGIPLKEVEEGIAPPSLGTLCQNIEMMEKPVVALLEGHVASAGLEMALAAHARIATRSAKLGLPDFRLGLSPGGGATQRLPRLIGAEGALEMLLEAQPHSALSPLCQPIVDRFCDGVSPLDDAVTLAAELAQEGTLTRTRDRMDGMIDPIAYQREIKARREQPSDVLTKRIIEAVEAAQLLPFEVGLALESTCFDDLRTSSRSQGLRRARHSEQRANRLTSIAGPQVTRIAVMGNPQLMLRIGGAAILGGAGATLFDPEDGVAEDLRIDLHNKLRPALTARGSAAVMVAEAGLKSSADPESLREAQMIVIMASGRLATLAPTLERIEPHLSDEAVIMFQTEQSDYNLRVPASLEGRVFGLALCDRDFPARAAEVSVPDTAQPAALATVQSGLWKLNRLLVRSRALRPMLIPTLFDTMMGAADGLVRLGVVPSRIERAMLKYGFARSPYALLMQADAPAYLARTMDRRPRIGLSHRVLTESIIPIVDNRTSVVLDYAATDMIEEATPEMTDRAIAGAMTSALANVGCRLIADGSAFRPMEIDALMLHGFGYPRGRGGPMADADLNGLRITLERCRALQVLDPEIWTPHPMLEDFYLNGLAFRDLDQRDQDARAA